LLSNYLTKLAHSAAHSAIQNALKRTTPMAKRMQELRKPGNQSTQTRTNGKQNSPSVSSAAPSVSSAAPSVSSAVNTRHQSARLTKPTVQYQSYSTKRAQRMYIRTLTTVEEEAPAINCMSSLPPTPSPTPSSPIPDSSNDTSERGTSPDNGRLAPPHRPAFYPARPGSTRPVTPQSEDAGGNGSRDDGSNRDNRDMEMLMTATKKTGPPSQMGPWGAIATTTTTPTALPTSTCSGDWPMVQESTGWSTNTGQLGWTNMSTDSWEYSPSLAPTIQVTSSNTYLTYPCSLEPSKHGKGTWKNMLTAKTPWTNGPQQSPPPTSARKGYRNSRKRTKRHKTENKHANAHMSFCKRQACHWHRLQSDR
jgi:hypothetical protein